MESCKKYVYCSIGWIEIFSRGGWKKGNPSNAGMVFGNGAFAIVAICVIYECTLESKLIGYNLDVIF